MAVFLKIETCSNCPFIDHSGAFTKGGAQMLCGHEDHPKELEHDLWRRPLLDKNNPTKVPDEIPSWCPLRSADNPVQEACKCRLCGAFPMVGLVQRWEKPSSDDYWQVGCNHKIEGITNYVLVKADSKKSVISIWNKLNSGIAGA